ncbi:MAG: hypothetical protein RIF46_00445 [Cyclobacteriaceae bacterium]
MRRIITIIVLLNASMGIAQTEFEILVDGNTKRTIRAVDSVEVVRFTDQFLSKLWREGYVFAGLDSIRKNKVFLHQGDRVKIADEQFKDFSQMYDRVERDLKSKANSGYPFARVVWDSVRVVEGNWIIQPSLIDGPLILNDSIVLLSTIKTKRSFLAKTIGFEKGEVYSERDFKSAGKRLDRIQFISARRPPDISFQAGKAWAYLDLEESNTGSFRGVIGLLPNQSSANNVLITGSIDLRLENLFKSGKLLDISWDRFGELSQQLDLQYEHPYLAGSDLFAGGEFHLLRQDSSFIKQGVGLNLNFFLKDRISMGVGFEQETSSVLLSSAERISAQNLLDYDQNRYSITFGQMVANPSVFKNYFGFNFKLGVGQRSLARNARLPDTYYDSLRMNTTNVFLQLHAKWQRKLTKNSGIYHSFSSAHLSGILSQNQLFRLGGLQSLRGFNEQFFFAQSYIVNQVEWRLFFEQDSYLFAFVDQGLVYETGWNSPTGFGGGFSLNTNSGLFSFAMALGGVEGLPLNLANTKVHFGYLSRF